MELKQSNSMIRLRSMKLLNYYFFKIEEAVEFDRFADIAYYNYMIEKEKEVLGIKKERK
jgi:hypothetical protein